MSPVPEVWSDGLLPPQLDGDTLPFWEAAREHRLTYQRCEECDAVVFFPRRHCTSCRSLALRWEDSAGRGEIYTYTVVRSSRDPRFVDRVPYAVALVDLDEGFRMMSNIVGIDADRVRVGQRVQVTWRTSGEWQLPVFAPEPAGD